MEEDFRAKYDEEMEKAEDYLMMLKCKAKDVLGDTPLENDAGAISKFIYTHNVLHNGMTISVVYDGTRIYNYVCESVEAADIIAMVSKKLDKNYTTELDLKQIMSNSLLF